MKYIVCIVDGDYYQTLKHIKMSKKFNKKNPKQNRMTEYEQRPCSRSSTLGGGSALRRRLS